MTWTLDIDGNLVNLAHIECICIQERDKTFKEKYQILAMSNTTESVLFRSETEEECKAKMEYLTDMLV